MKRISRQITLISLLLALMLPNLCAADGPLAIETLQMLDNGNVDTSYPEKHLSASGGTSPYTWKASGILPPGISVSTDGVVSGIPTSGGSYTFMVKVTDAVSAVASKQMLLTVISQPVVMPASKPDKYSNCTNCHTTGQPIPGPPVTTINTYPPSPSNTSESAFWFTTNVPTYTIRSECSIDNAPFATCVTPAVYYLSDGSHTFMVRSIGLAGEIESPPVNYTWNIYTAPLVIITTSLPNAVAATPYMQTMSATGGVPPLTWYIPPADLPRGMNLDPSTGVISGTPTVTGYSAFTAKVTDYFNVEKIQQLWIQVLPPLSTTTVSLPSGLPGISYSATMAASGGALPYNWSIDSGTLPAGLTLNGGSGVISGAPTAPGTFPVTFRVTDSASAAATIQLTVSIDQSIWVPPSFFYQTFQNAVNNAPGGGILQIPAKTFTENVLLNRLVALTLKGGYDSSYISNLGTTILQGTLTIQSGSATLENITIR